MAAAALPEEAGATPAVGRRRLDRLPALRAGGPAAPSWAALEAEACARPRTWSNPALVRRFEELAGFRLVGEDGRLTLGGFPGWTFDDVAAGAPGLQDSAMGGGRAVSRRAFRHAERLEALERKRTAGGSAVGEAEGEGVEGVPPTVNGSSGGGDGGGSNGAMDAPRLNGLLRMPSLNTLDYTPSLVFAPRFEASRFLADLLLLSCNREDYRARKIQSLDRLDQNPAGFKDRRKPRLEGQIGASIDGGLALLVAASLKRLQDEREAGWAVNSDAVEGGGGGLFSGGGGGGASGSGGGQEKQAASASAAASMSSGFTLDQLHTELHQLLAVKVSRAVALQGIVAAPGVVRGAHERCWWAYHPDAVRSAIVGVGTEGEEEEEEEEAQVAEIRGFFTRAFNLGRPKAGDTESARQTARQPQQAAAAAARVSQRPPAAAASAADARIPVAPHDSRPELATLVEDGVVSAEERT
ncbi:hypothetical protein Esi_0074_0082 [Ectocarpus siliculosus]|uniref:Uncharacterized protein n=1 Tax=Ectocarpus siliculosus TaxID=2880 RepID=D8LSL9_ECTSI|nr:hypothetical protein Esi_0074_0082 [Ectocarpus siliculosus]|eukprot:CBN77856.1 hypothetical protein Esi_0074_0082 [Ectocarpus siliculosus]